MILIPTMEDFQRQTLAGLGGIRPRQALKPLREVASDEFQRNYGFTLSCPPCTLVVY